MRSVLIAGGAILMLMGIVWFLQGIAVLPGSFMSGQSRWAINGCIAIAAGLLIIAFAWRRPRR